MGAFTDLLRNRPVICDGAVGTELYSRTGTTDQCIDHLNLLHPDVVRSIHRDYVSAGAQIIETNTFGANHIRLAAHGLEDMVREINLAGIKLARETAGDKALVAGSMGPTGKLLEPYGPLTVEEASAAFKEQAQAFREGGVDVIFVETMSDIRELSVAVEAAHTSALPVAAMMSFAQEGHTMMGLDAESAVGEIEKLGVDALGANCGTGFHDMLEVVTKMVAVATKPVMAQPNAGFPQLIDGRMVYRSSPQYLADYAKQFAELGVAIIGGCCGTTPQHIRAIAEALRG